MDRLRSWWRWWKAGQAEDARRAPRDVRFRRIEGDALRIAARTLPVTLLLALVAGRMWLPETIERTDILRLAAVAGVFVLGVFWLTVKVVRERRGAILTNDLAMPPRRALVLYAATALAYMALVPLMDWLLDWSTSWSVMLGTLTGLAVWPLVPIWRWRRDQARLAEAG